LIDPLLFSRQVCCPFFGRAGPREVSGVRLMTWQHFVLVG
jgi:hypothetical protein